MTERKAPVARLLGLPASSVLALFFSHTSLSAQDLSTAVRVGPSFVDAGTLSSALSECEQHAAHMSAVSCVDTFFVPKWLMEAEAERSGLAKSQALRHVRADILHARLVETLAAQLPSLTEEDIDEYLKKHQRDFEKPLRIRIYRILLDTEEDARSLLQKVTATTNLTDFRAWARDHSIDRATNQRAGDLGFVWPDGSTDIPQVSAETTLYQAALTLEDGEIGKEPVREGPRYAVIWRRGSLPAVSMNEQSRMIARLRLGEQRTEAQLRKILTDSSALVRGRNDELLGKLRRNGVTLFQTPAERR
jgi:hypothetical protein